MIIARGTSKSGELLLLGLSTENLNRLLAGEPIHIRPETHSGCPKDWEIVIITGTTELTMMAELKSLGALDGDTQIKVDSRHVA